jgi:hypothetical protein
VTCLRIGASGAEKLRALGAIRRMCGPSTSPLGGWALVTPLHHLWRNRGSIRNMPAGGSCHD